MNTPPKPQSLTAEEIQIASVAVMGLERLYTKVEERSGPHDDRLVVAIQMVKAMLRDAVKT